MQSLDTLSFYGYRRGATPHDGCVGVLKGLTGDELVLTLVGPKGSTQSADATSASPAQSTTAQNAVLEVATAAAKADLDIEFVLSSSSSAWGSSFSSLDDTPNPNLAQAQTASTADEATMQLPSHGTTFVLTQTPQAAETHAWVRRVYGGQASSLWWVLLGYSSSGDRAYLCPHHTPLAAVLSATAAAAPPVWCLPNPRAAFTHTDAHGGEPLLRDITPDILGGRAGVLSGSDVASHHFVRVPVGCARAAPVATATAAGSTNSEVTLVWSPPLDTTLLPTLFGVCPRPSSDAPSTGLTEYGCHTYVLSKANRTPVQFLGVALGVPWIIDAEGQNVGASSSSAPPDAPSGLDFADPLPGCYQGDALMREYGLRGSQPTTPPPARATEACSPTRAHVAETATSANRADISLDTATAVGASSPSTVDPPRPSSLPYFTKGRKVAVPGPYGVLLECDVTPAVLEKRFGVAHADRLRVRSPDRLRRTLSAAEWEELDLASHHAVPPESPLARQAPLYVTVMGVAMGAPVTLFDQERKAVLLRTVRGVEDMKTRFIKVSGTDLPPPALPLEPEAAASTVDHPPPPPRHTPRPAAYDEFRSSTSSSDVDECVPDAAAPSAPERASTPRSPSATPSQIAPSAETATNADAAPAAADEHHRDPSLAPTELGVAAPAVADRPARDTTHPDVSGSAAVPPDTVPGNLPRAQESPEDAPTALQPEVGAPAGTSSAGSRRRDSSASPAIVLPTYSTDRAHGLASLTNEGVHNQGDALDDDSQPRLSATHGRCGAESGRPLTDFLKAYALYQLERQGRTSGDNVDRHITVHDLQQYYLEQPLKRVMAAMEAQRRCEWLWGREGQFASREAAQLAWAELCVDEVAEYLLARESVLQTLTTHVKKAQTE